MFGGKHLQRESNREFTYQAFFTEAAPRLFVAAIIHEGDQLLAMPDLEVPYQPAHGSLEDVVVDALVRYLNDTTFGEGTAPDTRLRPVDFGPYR